MTKEYIVIVNPNAGNGRGRKDWPLIEAQIKNYNLNYRTIFTTGRGHAVEICSQEFISGNRNFIVVGGDGTLNEAINGFFSVENPDYTDITLANIPVGTGNDWCRTYKIPTDYKKAVEIISKGKIFLQDVGLASFFVNGKSETKYFMNVAGMGFDAFVAFQTNLKKEEGKGSALIYLYTLLRSLFSYKSTRVKIITNNKILEDIIFSMSFGIGKYNGGGMMQLPNAVTNDGLFDVTIIKNMGKLEVITNIRRLYDGSIIYHPKIDILSASKIQIESNPPISLEVDGEKCGITPVTLEILHQALPVIIP